MKYVNKLTLLLALALVLLTSLLVPGAWRTHYVMILIILLLGFTSLMIRKYHYVHLIPGVSKKHVDEIDTELISGIIGNLFFLITAMLAVFEIGELVWSGFTRTFIWFSVIPVAIYVRIMFHKISK